jgi:hypothetical protein
MKAYTLESNSLNIYQSKKCLGQKLKRIRKHAVYPQYSFFQVHMGFEHWHGVSSNCMMICESWIVMDLEGCSSALFEELPWNLPVGTEENYEKTQSTSECSRGNFLLKQSQWLRGVRYVFARTMGSWVRIPFSRHIWVYFMFVSSCLGSGLATGLSPVQEVLPTVYNTFQN